MILSLTPEAFFSTLLVSAWGPFSIHLIILMGEFAESLCLHDGKFWVMAKLWGELADSQPRAWGLKHEQNLVATLVKSDPPL